MRIVFAVSMQDCDKCHMAGSVQDCDKCHMAGSVQDINHFPMVEVHYIRKDCRIKYLDSNLSLSDMYHKKCCVITKLHGFALPLQKHRT